MPVPASINDLSTTPGLNSPSGSENPTTADDYFRTLSAFIAGLRDKTIADLTGKASAFLRIKSDETGFEIRTPAQVLGDIGAASAEQGFDTGDIRDTLSNTARTGWVYLAGRSIGNAASGATERAHADCLALYILAYTTLTNAEAPVSGGRTGNATNDFNNGKTLTLPDARGRVSAGKDDMGGSTAGRLTSGASGIVGTTLGASGGAQTVTLTTAEMPAHAHGLNDPGHSHSMAGLMLLYGQLTNISSVFVQSGSTATTHVSTNITMNNAGSGGAHQNTQPTLIVNRLIKL